MNVLLGVGVIWYVLTPHKVSNRSTLRPSSSSNEPGNILEPPNERDLWSKAEQSTNQRQAYHYLDRIEDIPFLLEQAAPLLKNMKQGIRAEFETWPFRQALIQAYGAKCQAPEELLLLRDITAQPELSLTLRDAAFRSYIENTLRFIEDSKITAEAFGLIDLCFNEPNSLSTTSLQAEHFLTQKGFVAPDGRKNFILRLIDVIQYATQPLQKRMTALNILATSDGLAALNVSYAFENSEDQLRTAILRALTRSHMENDLSWLKRVVPSTPEQEQLIGSLLH